MKRSKEKRKISNINHIKLQVCYFQVRCMPATGQMVCFTATLGHGADELDIFLWLKLVILYPTPNNQTISSHTCC